MDCRFFCNGTCVPAKLQVKIRLTSRYPPALPYPTGLAQWYTHGVKVHLSMQETEHSHSRLRFGVFEMDLRTGELRKHGMQVRLQKQPFQVLAMLLEHAGEVVTREELQKNLWPADTFVDFDHGLNKAINKIRDALGDSAENPRFLETVSRRGYRFLAEVKDVDAGSLPVPTPGIEVSSAPQYSDAAKAAPQPVTRQQVVPSLTSRRLGAILAALLVILAASALYFRYRPSSSSIRSLAVLPLESLSGDASQDYFADGMTDELITDLGQISALRVISRTSVMSYKRVRKPLPQIARELNVDGVVEGTVLRSGNQVRITAQLIKASDDKHLWAHSYEGDFRDALALQSQVARSIAEQIRINVSPREETELKSVKVVNPQAYESYLKGRFFWNKRTADALKVAAAYFNEAVEEDPNYSQAYSGLADTYALLGDWQYAVMTPKEALPKAKAAAIKALELNNNLGEAHNSLAFCLDAFDWDFASAEKEFRRAIELNPSYATAHHWYAWHLSLLGRNSEAISEMKKAKDLDPLSLIISADLAELLLIAHAYDESIRQSRRTIEMDANFALAHNQLAQAYLQKQMFPEAVAELQKAIQLSGRSPTFTANLARAYAAMGKKKEAMDLLDDLKQHASPGYSRASEIAAVYIALGDNDQAMTWLEKGFAERFNPGVLLRPGFDPIRSDPRFQNLLHRIGLG
jgi:TolB-like protein/DNA-binding winged helix-turn-helix (wHTH) protein/Flp pilus assembly protein TadD